MPATEPCYGGLIFTVAATFKSRQAQSEDCGYGFIENALNRWKLNERRFFTWLRSGYAGLIDSGESLRTWFSNLETRQADYAGNWRDLPECDPDKVANAVNEHWREQNAATKNALVEV